MAFDGVTIAGIVNELKEIITGNRIYKIAQPEKDELILTIKGSCGQVRLLLSADASLPLIYMTDKNKTSPMTAPNFCMLLRKHLQNAKIVSVSQPGLERVVRFELEHLNELGDLCRKYLIIELMGKHSNIIFCDDQNTIIDSIKHISGMVSSVREVLPGREYFIPKTQDKAELLKTKQSEMGAVLKEKNMSLYKAIYSGFTGLSPCVAHELCYRAEVDSDKAVSDLSAAELEQISDKLYELSNDIKDGRFTPNVVYENKQPKEYAATRLTSYSDENTRIFATVSALLEYYYAEKNMITRIRQRSVDLRRIVQTALERNVKKYDLQLKQLSDTEKREKYRIYGELLNAYGYGVEAGAASLEALNYYDNQMITIPLDSTLSTGENAKKYFEKYQKLKRTYEALTTLTADTKAEIEHLSSISTSLDIALKEEDLVQIKEELIESGYIKRKGGARGKQRREKITSKPFHYVSSDGYHIYVGKNNYQNEELTFKLATGNDWWFHAKGIPGSHVVVKANGEEMPDRVFEEAGKLAAHYSQARGQEKVEIDYTQKKNVKKPNGSKPGFVVYYTNYSLVIDSDITSIEQIED
ncbi:MAG: fibronectin/fibrinogen-binding protein [Lachnospiraceae bacterium]|nr:fibronectin/fibrinogen-binding protein [Lachnospiraceae bacterium]